MPKIKTFPFLAIITGLYIFINPTPIYAQSKWVKINPKCVVGDVPTITGLECLFANVLTIALTGIGVIMFIMLIFGGIKLLTGSGDPKAIESGKGTITLAVIGLIVAILAWFILAIISEFTGIDALKTFTIPS